MSVEPQATADSRSRSLEELSAREVLALAIHLERANARRFRSLASSCRQRDPKVARSFEEMAREEDNHEWLLRQQLYRHFGDELPTIEQLHVGEVAEPVAPQPGEDLSALTESQAYEMALDAEEAAHAFYLRAAAACHDPALAALYGDLAALESEHVSWCHDRLASASSSAQFPRPG